MKTIAIMSPKGGIGKTTTADAIAYILGEEKKKKVLVLDGDPQGDTSKIFGAYEPEGAGMSELLEHHRFTGGNYTTWSLIQQTEYSTIDIIPANGYLMKTDMELMMRQESNQITRLRDALKEVQGLYDYCVCDCGRLLDMVVLNILMAADVVIAPIKVGGYENDAIYTLQEQLDELEDGMGKRLGVIGLMTMRQKNKTTLEFEEWMRTMSGFLMFDTPVRRSIVVEKASMARLPLPKFSRNGITTKDYRAVVEELLQNYEDMEGSEREWERS